MCIAGAEDTDAVSERSLSLHQGSTFFNTDFHGVLFTEQRQIQETLFLFFVHILDQHGVIAVILIVGCAACTGPQPFAVFLYVKVITSRCERTAVDAIACVTEFSLYGDDRRVSLENDSDSGRLADLKVLAFRKALILYGVHAVVRVRSVRKQFSDKCKVRCFSKFILHILWGLREGSCSQAQKCSSQCRYDNTIFHILMF